MLFETGRQLTLDLYILIGLYGLAAGAGGLLAKDRFDNLIDALQRESALGYLAGLIAFVWGGAQSLAHWEWGDLPAAVISFIGLFILAEGLLLIAAPEGLLTRFVRLVRPIAGRAYAAFAVLFGALFIAIGLLGRVSL
ncbi:MAG: hypothetical protein V2I43_03190 [Parvularcula sp.]|jgi:hypothetical protein|nr:hypothetical protein [Parvularcula sp.]